MTAVQTERPGLMRAGGAVERVVPAPPDAVWALLADVTRTGEWSPECRGAQWLDGATTPVAGARFRGVNRWGLVRWTRVCEVVTAEPARELSWRTVPTITTPDSTLWRFVLEPVDGGTRVLQSYEVLVPLPVVLQRVVLSSLMPHHADMRPHMALTLERLAERLTAGSGLPGSTNAAPGPIDLTNMHLMHHAFRRDLEAFTAAAGRTPAGDVQVWRALAARWDRFATTLHHHHVIEDDSIWPAVVGAAEAAGDTGARTVLDALEAEHEVLDPALDGCARAFAAMAAHPSTAAQAGLVDRVVALRRALLDHLRHEETEGLPLVQRWMSAQAWAVSEERAKQEFGLRDVAFALPWVVQGLPEGHRARMLSSAGPVFRALLRTIEPAFLRRERLAFRHA
jgi:iron-sulfur cluster repair protein YtfE (RIC family)